MQEYIQRFPWISYEIQMGNVHGVRLVEYHSGDGSTLDIVNYDLSPEQVQLLVPLCANGMLWRPFEVQGITARPSVRGTAWWLYDQEGRELSPEYPTPGRALRAMLTDWLRARWKAPELSNSFPIIKK